QHLGAGGARGVLEVRGAAQADGRRPRIVSARGQRLLGTRGGQREGVEAGRGAPGRSARAARRRGPRFPSVAMGVARDGQPVHERGDCAGRGGARPVSRRADSAPEAPPRHSARPARQDGVTYAMIEPRLFRGRSMVGPRPLEPLIVVRIHASEPAFARTLASLAGSGWQARDARTLASLAGSGWQASDARTLASLAGSGWQASASAFARGWRNWQTHGT